MQQLHNQGPLGHKHTHHTQAFMGLESAIHLNKRWLTLGAHCEPPMVRLTLAALSSQWSTLVSVPLRAQFVTIYDSHVG